MVVFFTKKQSRKYRHIEYVIHRTKTKKLNLENITEKKDKKIQEQNSRMRKMGSENINIQIYQRRRKKHQ